MTFNNICHAGVVALALCLAACSGGGPNTATAVSAAVASPIATSSAPPQHASPATKAGPPDARPDEFVTGTLCTRPDQVVFSCPLEKTNKIVSICATGNAAPHRFYYAFGKTNAPELVYPPKGDFTTALNRTGQIYAGGTGSEAYSFHRGGFEYITFTLSGKGFSEAGILVRHVGADRAILHLPCDQTRLMEVNNSALDDELLQLRPEPDLKYALPDYDYQPGENQ